MKQTASILLLALLAFNFVGYRFVSDFLEQNADNVLSSRIDNQQYNADALIEIRVPMNAPYLSGSNSEFEPYDGEVELNGTHYRYVKRKIENGELVLMCLPNESKTRFQNSRVDFFKLVNDLTHSASGKEKNTSGSFKSFTTDYKQEDNSWTIKSLSTSLPQHMAFKRYNMAAGFSTVIIQPPRINC